MADTIKGVHVIGGRISKTGLRIPLLLVGIVVLGASLRIIAMVFFTGAIDTEGAEYARIAENLMSGKGYEGIATPGVELMFPPLYPLLIAALSFLVRDFELAARLVCVIFGSALPIVIYFVSSRLYDRQTSLIAATVVAFHPLLINLSASTYSEGPYMTVLLVGTYSAIRCRESAGMKWFLATGVAFGMAYLIRPEAFIMPFIAAVFIAVVRRKNIGMAWRRTAILFVTFFVVAGPYIWFLYHETGQLRFEGKTPINFEIGRRLLAGEGANEVSYGLGANLQETGIWMRSNADVLKKANISSKDIIRFALRAGRTNLPILVKQLGKASWLGSPLLLFLAIVGLFSKPWVGEKRPAQLFLLSVVASSAAGLVTIVHGISGRYFFLYLPFLLIWAAYGAVCLGEWAVLTIDATDRWARLSKFIGSTVGALPMIGLLVLSLMTIGSLGVLQIGGKQSRPVEAAGVWLRSAQAGPITVMDSQTNLAFHAGAMYVAIPDGSPETVLAYADRKRVDFIVLRPSGITGRRVLEDWTRFGIDHNRAELVYSSPSSLNEGLYIYRWKRLSR